MLPLMRRGYLPEFLKLAASLKTDLREQQRRVLEKLDRSDGVVVIHGLGSGKTLTSIAAGAETGLPLEVIAPAPLVSNYEKEVAKHVEGDLPRRVRSYASVSRSGELNPDALLVLDEAHHLRNTGTKRYRTVALPAREAQKRLLLTGTPIYNRPSDLGPLVNIATGKKVLPERPTDFRKEFVREEFVNPSFLQRVRGATPGVRYHIQNESLLRDALVGRVDVHDAGGDAYPERVDESFEIPMSDAQQHVYDYLLGQAPASLRVKIKAGLPPSKQEAKQLNAFLTGVRQASSSPRPYIDGMGVEEETRHTPKLQRAAEELVRGVGEDPNFKGLVYSNYLGAGLEPYSRRLEAQGIAHHVFTGAVSKKEKAMMVKDYNEGRVPVLLVSSSGTEGLDLKGTKVIQVLEPHFNNSKIEQVIGRGIRYQSHDHLPPEERTVRVQRFFSTVKPKGLLRKKQPMSTEQWLQQQADDKDRLTAEFRKVIEEASGR